MPARTQPALPRPHAAGRVFPLRRLASARTLDAGSSGPGAADSGPLLGWHEIDRFATGIRYREVPTGRTGWFVGLAEVPALDRLHISTAVVVFRCITTQQMFSYSQLDARVGVAYEELGA